MRVVPGARPPRWQWKITKKSRVRVLEQVAMDQVELEIYRVHGLTDKTDNRGSVWIKFDLGYPKDEKIGKGFTQSYRSDHDTVNMVNMDYKTPCYVKRARSTQMAFQNDRTGLEIFHKKNIGREKNNPFAVENLDNNNVLEAEIEAVTAKAASGDLASVMRKGALETKLLMLVLAVQSGELDLKEYCGILRERVIRDKVLAIHLKKETRTKEAVAVMKRMRAMEEELAGVPPEEDGERGGGA